MEAYPVDSQLIMATRQGNSEAFSELVKRHQRMCLGIAHSCLPNGNDAEDQVQTAFLKAYTRLDQYDGSAEFSTWLGRIVVNECLMLRRAQRRYRLLYLDDSFCATEGTCLQLSRTEPDSEGELRFKQLTQVLRAEIDRIPKVFREVLKLRDIQELPVKEVANRLGITLPAAKSRLVRARSELRRRISRSFPVCQPASVLSRKAVPLNQAGRRQAQAVQRRAS